MLNHGTRRIQTIGGGSTARALRARLCRRRTLREGSALKRAALIGAAVGVAALAARQLARRAARADFEKRIAAMPDGSPRKWILSNVAAIRANTERILELLERQAAAGREDDRAPDRAGGEHG